MGVREKQQTLRVPPLVKIVFWPCMSLPIDWTRTGGNFFLTLGTSYSYVSLLDYDSLSGDRVLHLLRHWNCGIAGNETGPKWESRCGHWNLNSEQRCCIDSVNRQRR